MSAPVILDLLHDVHIKAERDDLQQQYIILSQLLFLGIQLLPGLCLGGNTLLIELMPIPKSKVRQWNYKEFIQQFASRKKYCETIKPCYVGYLSGLLKEHNPYVFTMSSP